MLIEIEHFFKCPFCGEEISMILDLSEAAQSYIEDCEVCCRPIELSFSSNADGLESFSAEAVDQ